MNKLKKINFSDIKMVLMDCDGVLTDGTLPYLPDGTVLKVFHAHDGYGIEQGRMHGLKFAIISGKFADANKFRADRLKIQDLYQNCKDKTAAAEDLSKKYNIPLKNMCFIGDDVFDIPLLQKVGFSASPPEALNEVKKLVHYITKASAGRGCVREVIDLILKKQRKI